MYAQLGLKLSQRAVLRALMEPEERIELAEAVSAWFSRPNDHGSADLALMAANQSRFQSEP
jgi:hypothetical protein